MQYPHSDEEYPQGFTTFLLASLELPAVAMVVSFGVLGGLECPLSSKSVQIPKKSDGFRFLMDYRLPDRPKGIGSS